VESAVYKPFGEQTEFVTPGVTAPESKGWIGERYDADAGLQYLNARYYDPVLGLFLQPDWFEVLQPGVGTNWFSYAFNDPVNKLDPMGNAAVYGPDVRGGPNRYQGDVGPRDPGYGNIACGCGLGGRNPTAGEWARVNNAIRTSVASLNSRTEIGGPATGPIPDERLVYFENLAYIDTNPYLSLLSRDPTFSDLALRLLELSNYRGPIGSVVETGGVFTIDISTGRWSFALSFDPNATRTQITHRFAVAPAGSVNVIIHTHPASGRFPSFDVARPSPADLAGAFPGFVVTRTHGVYGYHGGRYQ
jgi:RHS repeat-associated protein